MTDMNIGRHPEQPQPEIELPVIPEIEQETIPEIGHWNEQTGTDHPDTNEYTNEDTLEDANEAPDQNGPPNP